MAYIKLDQEKCKGCMLCIEVCPKGQLKPGVALNKKGINPVMFLAQDCSGCTFCAIICPDTAIEVYK
ncbi:MAG: tungsten formylmethanofuran dehydrogenase [Omnitrophica WOR_2 bacterium RIFCSPHIGHO2_02_FULL_45_21]|nr:MAG: tungsten formylmethanofuran dehydrogenase [Omnitrophica WOR_2 bacterium RIFCSPHIGHO2_02_FULL_45_21]